MALGQYRNSLIKPVITFIAGFLFYSLSAQEVQDFTVLYKGAKPVGVSFPAPNLKITEIEVRKEGSKQKIFGKISRKADSIFFNPTFPFDSNLKYNVVYQDKIIGSFGPKSINKIPTVLLGIYPKADSIPVNILKMQLVFSSPMSTDRSYEYIHFYQNKNEIFPYLPLQPELWNQDKTVLTLWLDPGRIKRHLVRSDKLGSPLQTGQNYEISIDNNWLDADGYSLAKGETKSIYTKRAIRKRVDANDWKIDLPRSGTKSPLAIHFDRTMDWLLLHENINIFRKNVVEGKIIVDPDAKKWTFVPKEPWEAGKHEIQIQAILEDLAGNNLNYAFDRDIKIDQRGNKDVYTIEFNL